jgi:hypothetical protein
LARERRKGGLDRLHGAIKRRAEVAILGALEDDIEPRALRQVQRPAAGEVGFDQRPAGHLARLFVGIDCGLGHVKAIGRMAQEDQAHDGHEVFIRRQIGVRPQIVGDFPKVGTEFLDPLKVVGRHGARVLSCGFERRIRRRFHPRIHPRFSDSGAFSVTIARRSPAQTGDRQPKQQQIGSCPRTPRLSDPSRQLIPCGVDLTNVGIGLQYNWRRARHDGIA